MTTDDSLPECRRYMDDYPGVRAECERKIAAGTFCYDCPKNPQSDAAKLATAEARIAQLDSQLTDAIAHALKLDNAECEALRKQVAQYREALREARDVIDGLVGQQAMADDFWKQTAVKIDCLLAPRGEHE